MALKSDIRINYSTIANIRDSIGTYKTAIETMEQALKNINNVLETGNSGEAIYALIDKYKELQSDIDSCKEELKTLYDLFNGYYKDMTDIIKPIDESYEMQVDKSDIWLNMSSIFDSLIAIESVAISGVLKPYYDYSTDYSMPSMGVADSEEQKTREQNNYRKMEEIWDVIKSYRNWFQSDKEYMASLFNNKIVPYEEKDNEYANMANTAYLNYSNDEERKEIFKQHASELFEGLGQGIEDIFSGTINLAKGGGKYGLGFLGWLTSNFTNNVPDILSDYEEDFYKDNEAIKSFLDNPHETIEEIGQNVSDTYEEKGPYYSAGYIIPEVVAVFEKILPKSSKITKEIICKDEFDPSIFSKQKKKIKLEVGSEDIAALRKKWNVPQRDTLAVAKTDVKGLESITFEGGSPGVRTEAGLPKLDEVMPNRIIKSPSRAPLFTRHAEEDVANQFDEAVAKVGINPNNVTGTLYIHQSNPAGVCKICIQGLTNDAVKPGILKQLSLRYPKLVIKVTSEVDTDVKVNGRLNVTIQDGKYID